MDDLGDHPRAGFARVTLIVAQRLEDQLGAIIILPVAADLDGQRALMRVA